MATMLHELLAVENGLAETANRITVEVTKTLSTKKSIFTGMTKRHEIFSEDDQHLVQATERKEVQDTVNDQLDFASKALVQYWDVSLQKEEANQRAVADITIGGSVIASNVPSIVLLGMEKKLTSLLALYNAVPTLDSSISWEAEPGLKPGIFRTKHDTERQHTTTTRKFVEASAATKEHKAQVMQQDDIQVIGKYIVTDFSSCISSHDKAVKLENLTKLIRAVKSARQRANSVEVNTDLRFGKALMDYINN